MKDIDALLRRYDAAPDTPLTPAESARADELLTRISNTPRTDTVVRVPARRRPLVLSLAGVAAAASVIGAIVATQSSTHSSGHSASGASAPLSINNITKAELDTWMAAPADSSVIGKAASACLKGAKGAADPQVYAADQRGSVLTLLAKDPVSQQVWWCLDTPAGVVSYGFVTAPGWEVATKPAAAGTVNVLDLSELALRSKGGESTSLGFAYGQAGPGVTSVTLTFKSGGKLTASVQNGYWNVWWPESASLPDDMDGDTVTWTTVSGTSHTAKANSITQYLPGLWLNQPLSPGQPITSAASANSHGAPSGKATTVAAACGSKTPANVTNVVQVGKSFELVCTYPGPSDQWVVIHHSDTPANAELQDTTIGVSTHPDVAKNAVSLGLRQVFGPVGNMFGWAGTDVTSVTVVTEAGQKITAQVDNGLWTAMWPNESSKSKTDSPKTVIWTTTDGTAHTVSAG